MDLNQKESALLSRIKEIGQNTGVEITFVFLESGLRVSGWKKNDDAGFKLSKRFIIPWEEIQRADDYTDLIVKVTDSLAKEIDEAGKIS